MTVICSGRFDDMHEILSRARGGSITDPDNILLVCRSCHRWVTENPWAAEDLGASRKASQDPEAAKIKRAEKLPVWRNDLQSASDW
jgi:predicted metal-binding protein